MLPDPFVTDDVALFEIARQICVYARDHLRLDPTDTLVRRSVFEALGVYDDGASVDTACRIALDFLGDAAGPEPFMDAICTAEDHIERLQGNIERLQGNLTIMRVHRHAMAVLCRQSEERRRHALR